MSNNWGWKPRKVLTIECPSGQKVVVRRPGPEFTLRAGRIQRSFTRNEDDNPEDMKQQPGESSEDYHLRLIKAMSDEEIATLTVFAREMVLAMMVSPRLVLNPNPDKDEIGPDDVPAGDFWFLFGYAITNFMDLKVPVGDAEVEVKDLETFREDTSVSGDSVDGVHIPVTVSEPETSDRGLVGSAGV